MFNARYRIRELSTKLRDTASEIVELKRTMRQSRYLPSRSEYQTLRHLKHLATALCCLRAHHRGRMHLPNSLEMNTHLIEECEGMYLVKQEVAA
jgi:hypothetical protein